MRLRTRATLDGARISISVDIGFGDAIEPGAELVDYPVLLDLPAPRLRAYARETVVAEKFQAMVALGRANTRMKDFYDVWALSKTHAFDADRLSRAIAATFTRRNTVVPTEAPDALTPAFAAAHLTRPNESATERHRIQGRGPENLSHWTTNSAAPRGLTDPFCTPTYAILRPIRSAPFSTFRLAVRFARTLSEATMTSSELAASDIQSASRSRSSHRIPLRQMVRRTELRKIVPLADTTIYEMEQRGDTVKFSVKRSRLPAIAGES